MADQIQTNNISVIGLTGVNLNSANTDFPLDISFLKYIARRVTVAGPSVSLTGSPVTLGLFSQPNAGGVTIIPLTSLSGMGSTTRFADVPLTFNVFTTLPRVYFRVGVAHGSAATIDVYIEITPII